ncbi:phosphoglycolate phosphatase [Streptomyces sp. AcH 505]|jgi:phosphoglycolate phosphatase|uniref:phosphoglycolate phosphatase n=1 Tax=Streptomyces sp. AcH 505 TaxID=352211 RepID=UPI00099BA707
MPDFFPVQAIIFDLDGTLVDSAEDLQAALNQLLSELRLCSIGAEEIKAMIGDGVPKLVERGLAAANGDPEKADVWVPRFLEIYQQNPAALTRCYPDVRETLGMLHRRKFKLGVVTNKPARAARQILESLLLSQFFSVVVGGDTLQERKPHPAPLLEAARQLDLEPGQILMVGDNMHDVKAARAAGMRCVAVSYGYHHQPPSEFNADGLIDRFGDLLALVMD